MQFRAEEYYQASLERMKQARTIYREGTSFALAMYCGGLAVESLLRAFRWTEDTSFEGRHDLQELLRASRILAVDADYLRSKGRSEEEVTASRRKLYENIYVLVILWHNNFRFASEKSLKAFLRRIGRLKPGKGDPVKKAAQELLNAAQAIVDQGMVLWTSKTRS